MWRLAAAGTSTSLCVAAAALLCLASDERMRRPAGTARLTGRSRRRWSLRGRQEPHSPLPHMTAIPARATMHSKRFRSDHRLGSCCCCLPRPLFNLAGLVSGWSTCAAAAWRQPRSRLNAQEQRQAKRWRVCNCSRTTARRCAVRLVDCGVATRQRSGAAQRSLPL